MSGYCATGSARIAKMPPSMMNKEITHANTGRSMKKRAMIGLCLSG
ncbi:Uncharacterised protein [Burkholderia pseudomallei]|nr:hypothetical protein X896_6305 [Burkholderia pseudomallei ABCPW 1]CAJ3728810.1 Uncharacterised protein [Burkholderia pseudomallei]CAJ4520262.1 Uncharacterised protein [Burkholderia pseudomallei]CAJ7872980.1 Uncharacterised protein [Burkholderia pseudomallei]CAJ8004378.1 Uncharacterised protein [Burkholderia pseudomallei]